MKNFRKYRLLSKTSLIYLALTLLVFSLSTLFLIEQSANFINEELEDSFRHGEKRTIKALEKGVEMHKIRDYVILKEIQTPPTDNSYPSYKDTLIYISRFDAELLHRMKTTIIHLDDKYYELKMIRSLRDFFELRDSIINTLIPAFVILAIVIVLMNYILSGYFLRPFNKILTQMKTYSVGKKEKADEIKTSTIEFIRMQDLFHKMIYRIEKDYFNLKEYTENMAHEMQTPLSIIRNKAEMLMADDKLMASHSGAVKTIYDETNHLSNLGNALNLLTKIENKEYTANQTILTKEVIEKHISAVKELAELKNLEIKTNLDENHSINIDPFLLDILIKNLLRNAIRYANNATPIRIETDNKSLTFSNSAPEFNFREELLFKRFRKSGNNSSSLGLGLSIVKTLCDLNGLEITHRFKNGLHVFEVHKVQ